MDNFENHSGDYSPDAYLEYSYEELGQWVGLLMKRANMRTTVEKMNKDIGDARNYLAMMEAKLTSEIGEISVEG